MKPVDSLTAALSHLEKAIHALEGVADRLSNEGRAELIGAIPAAREVRDQVRNAISEESEATK